MKPEVFLKNFFKEKIKPKKLESLHKIDLIAEGILDSLDLVTLSILIKKNYNINININSEKTLLIFRSYKKILREINDKAKKI